MPISAQEWRARTGLNNAGRVCRLVSPAASKKEGVAVPLMGRGVCVSGMCVLAVPLLYKTYTLALAILLLLSGNLRSGRELGVQNSTAESSSPLLGQSEVCWSVVCTVSLPVLCMAYTLVVRMLLLLSGDVERNPGPTIIPISKVAALVELLSPAAAKWERLGFQLLQQGSSRLNTIKLKREHHPDWPYICLQDLLEYWVKNCEATVEYLASVLCGIDEQSLASTLCQHFGIDIPVSATVSKLPSCMARYRETLKEQYSTFSVLPDNDWPPSVGDQFINLALVQNRMDFIFEQADSVKEMQYDYVHGSLDKIVSYKKKITKEDIVIPMSGEGNKQKAPLRVLVDGAPGVGKTTLSRQLCKEWADGKMLQNYDLVVLVHLRERNNKQAKSIEDFFFHDPSISRTEVARHINKENVLLIFDGFDELSFEERTQHSLFRDIITGEVLHKCSLVVTSRPHASMTLQQSKSITRHVQVLGFTDEQINECIVKSVKDKSNAEGLRSRLKERLDLTSLCSIPLNCAIMLYVYQQENFRLPDTLTELFDTFVLNALKRHAKRKGLKRNLRSLDNLPPPLNSQFTALCKMAYEGLMADKLIFSDEDLEKAFGVDADADLLGLDLLTSTRSYSSRGDELTYHFLHLTIQEFLAGKWVAAMALTSPDEAVQLFKSNLKEDRFRLTLLFAAGLTKLAFSNPTSLFGEIDTYTRSHYNSDNELICFLCHLMYEARNCEFAKSVAHCLNGKLNLGMLGTKSIFDLIVLANFIKCSGRWKSMTFNYGYTRKNLDVQSSELKDFCGVFSKFKGLSDTVVKNLRVCYNMGEYHLDELLELEHIPCFRSVTIDVLPSQINNIKLSNVLKMKKLVDIQFTEFIMTFMPTDVSDDAFFDALRTNDSVRSLSFCPINSFSGPSLKSMLSQNKSLKYLSLVMPSKVDEQLFDQISQGLANNSELRELTIKMRTELNFNTMPAPIYPEELCISLCMRMAIVTPHLRIEKLTWVYMGPEFENLRDPILCFQTAKALIQLLASNTSLTHVQLSGIVFTERELTVLCDGLAKNKTLLQISFCYNYYPDSQYAILSYSTECDRSSPQISYENHLLSPLATDCRHEAFQESVHDQVSFQPNQQVSVHPTATCGSDSTAESRTQTVTPMRKCQSCEKRESQERKLRNCARCKNVAYCSKECQRNNWPVHQEVCRASVDTSS